jgi:hypothetical protein
MRVKCQTQLDRMTDRRPSDEAPDSDKLDGHVSPFHIPEPIYELSTSA